jgi:hypothetical protein
MPGVIVASPATQPVTIPTEVCLPSRICSTLIQVSPAAAAARCVARIADAADASAASTLPPLKPKQPTRRMPAPAIVMPGLCGGARWCGKRLRGPTMIAATSAIPAVVCTTMPPAKSILPCVASQPRVPHPVRNRQINQHQPDAREQHHHAEPRAPGKGADNQRWDDYANVI